MFFQRETLNYVFNGGLLDIPFPLHATHISVDESVTVIPGYAFSHVEIFELICHDGVKVIENDAFYYCDVLRKAVIPGVEVVKESAFSQCEMLEYVECEKLEIIEAQAFTWCRSLLSINLSSIREIKEHAFSVCSGMKEARFGGNLETMSSLAFKGCYYLERITIPLKNGFITNDNVFQGCEYLRRVDLIEGAAHETIAALHLKEWRNEMIGEIESINQILPEVDPGGDDFDNVGETASTIREWIARVLRKIIDYKSQHRHLLREVTPTLMQLLPNDVVMNNVLPFLELPSHTFDGEDQAELVVE